MSNSLADLRIGAVSYLNSLPLIFGLTCQDLILDVPSRLAVLFSSGELDVSLLPVFEILHSGTGTIVDGVAIACLGKVHSVMVASRNSEFSKCGPIHTDPSSRTSAALLKVLLTEYYPNGPLVLESGEIPVQSSRLLIGDPAIRFRDQHRTDWFYYDLGELWFQHTGLPFVFACWALRPGLTNSIEVAEELRNICQSGLAARSQIAAQEADPEFARCYLTTMIRYDLGDQEKKALKLFSTLLKKHGLIAQPPQLTFV